MLCVFYAIVLISALVVDPVCPQFTCGAFERSQPIASMFNSSSLLCNAEPTAACEQHRTECFSSVLVAEGCDPLDAGPPCNSSATCKNATMSCLAQFVSCVFRIVSNSEWGESSPNCPWVTAAAVTQRAIDRGDVLYEDSPLYEKCLAAVCSLATVQPSCSPSTFEGEVCNNTIPLSGTLPATPSVLPTASTTFPQTLSNKASLSATEAETLTISESVTVSKSFGTSTFSVLLSGTQSSSLDKNPAASIYPKEISALELRHKGAVFWIKFSAGAVLDVHRASSPSSLPNDVANYFWNLIGFESSIQKNMSNTTFISLLSTMVHDVPSALNFSDVRVLKISFGAAPDYTVPRNVTQEQVQISFDPLCFVSALAPPPVVFSILAPAITQLRVEPVPKLVADVVEVSTTVAVVGAAVMAANGFAATQAARGRVLLEAEACVVHWGELSYYVHPLQFSIGSEKVKFYAGAMLGNPALIVMTGIFHAFVVLLVCMCKKCSFLVAASVVHFPSLSFAPMMLLMQDSVTSLVVVLIYGEAINIRVFAGVMAAVWIAFPIFTFLVTAVPAEFPAVFLRFDVTLFFLGFGKWEDRSEALVRKSRQPTAPVSLLDVPGLHYGRMLEAEEQTEEKKPSFVARYSLLFTSYVAPRRWFLVIEQLVVIVMGAIAALRPEDCSRLFLAYFCLFAVYFLLTVALRPFLSNFLQAAATLIALLQLGATFLLLAEWKAGLAGKIAVAAMALAAVIAIISVGLECCSAASRTEGSSVGSDEDRDEFEFGRGPLPSAKQMVPQSDYYNATSPQFIDRIASRNAQRRPYQEEEEEDRHIGFPTQPQWLQSRSASDVVSLSPFHGNERRGGFAVRTHSGSSNRCSAANSSQRQLRLAAEQRRALPRGTNVDSPQHYRNQHHGGWGALPQPRHLGRDAPGANPLDYSSLSDDRLNNRGLQPIRGGYSNDDPENRFVGRSANYKNVKKKFRKQQPRQPLDVWADL